MDDQEPTAPYPVTADRPVELHNPVGRARVGVLLLVLGIVLASGGAGWVGYELAAQRTDTRVSALERDQQQRAAQRSAQIAQLRATACVVLNRLPADPDVEQQRALFGCGPRPPQPPPETPNPPGLPPGTVVPTPPAAPGGPGPQSPLTPGRPSPRPSPTPSPTRGGLCLPIFGCVG